MLNPVEYEFEVSDIVKYDIIVFNTEDTGGTIDNDIPEGTEVVVMFTGVEQEGDDCSEYEVIPAYRVVNTDTYFTSFDALNRHFNHSIRPDIVTGYCIAS